MTAIKRHWLAREEQFFFGLGSWECRVAPLQPERGAVVAWPDAALEAELMALPALQAGAYQAAESYVRFGDLHLVYAATKDLPTQVSLCWRLHDPAEWLPGLAAADAEETFLLECVISFQTDLLDAVPVREAHSHLPVGRFLPLPPPRPPRAGEIERPPSEQASLLEADGRLWLSAVYPSDLRWLAVSRDQQRVHQQIRLRAENLEKGVIRRLRSLFVVAPLTARAGLLELPERFAESQLPLSF